MKKIFIDTTEYKSDKSRLSKPFGQLAQLSIFNYIQIHISQINVHEIETTIVDAIRKSSETVLDAISKVSHYGLDESFHDSLGGHKKINDKWFQDASNSAIAKFKDWMAESKVVIHEIKPEDGQQVMKSYFHGVPPFQNKKNREDIPDAFVWQVLDRLSMEEGQVYFVSADNNFRSKVQKSFSNFITTPTLKDLFELPEIKLLVEDWDNFTKQANSEALKELIEQEIKVQKREIALEANRLIEYQLLGTSFKDGLDNLQGVITDVRVSGRLNVYTDYIQMASYPSVYINVDDEVELTVSSSLPITGNRYGARSGNFDSVISLSENSSDTHELGENYVLINLHAEFVIELTSLNMGCGKEEVIDAFENSEIKLTKIDVTRI